MSAQAQAIETPQAVQAWTRLLRAHATATRLLSAQLQEEHGLTINDYEALLVLSRADERRLKRVDLARRLLEGLERAGLVERAACDSDLRVTYAQLTDAGAAKVEDASCAHVGSVRRLFEDNLSSEEIDLLAAALGKLPGVPDEDESCRPGPVG